MGIILIKADICQLPFGNKYAPYFTTESLALILWF